MYQQKPSHKLGLDELKQSEYCICKLTDTRADTAVMASNTALFAVFTASSRVTTSFLSNMSVSISVDRRK